MEEEIEKIQEEIEKIQEKIERKRVQINRKKTNRAEINKEEINREEINKEETWRKQIRRWIVLFFISMFILTFFSRAAASITVPIVTVTKVQGDYLEERIEGNGKLETVGQQLISVQENMKILDVFVREGDKIEKGDSLFAYDLSLIEKQIISVKEALHSSEREYKRTVLNQSILKESGQTKAEEREVEDTKQKVEQAENEIKKALENFELMQLKLEEAELTFRKKVEKIETRLSEEKKEEIERASQTVENLLEEYNQLDIKYKKQYDNAVKEIAQAQEEKKKKRKTAEQELEDARYQLKILTNKLETMTAALTVYTEAVFSRDYEAMQKALEEIKILYFGEEKYDSIVKSQESASLSISLARKELESIRASWAQEIEYTQSLIDGLDKEEESYEVKLEELNRTMEQQKKERDIAVLEAQKTVDTAIETYQGISDKMTSIEMASSEFINAVCNKEKEIEKKYTKLYNIVTDTSQISDMERYNAETLVQRKTEALTELEIEQNKQIDEKKEMAEQIKQEWQRQQEDCQKKINHAKEEQEKVFNKVYEAEESIETARGQVKTAEEQVKLAREQLETTNNIYEEAKKAQIRAEENLEEAKENIIKDNANEKIQKELDRLSLEEYKEKIEKNQRELKQLEEMISDGGIVKSKETGILTKLEITPRMNTTGTEKVAIALKKYVFIGSFPKEKLEYMKEGDVIRLKLATEKKEIEIPIHNIAFDVETKNYKFEAELEESDYIPETPGTYTIIKRSEYYEQCVPISAVRTDSKGDYVLVIEETKSILGNELNAVRIGITVQKKDYKLAAIDTAGLEGKKIISGSDNIISEGDRVRLN